MNQLLLLLSAAGGQSGREAKVYWNSAFGVLGCGLGWPCRDARPRYNHHLRNRPNLRTGGGLAANPWLFPGHRPGTHLDPQSIMQRLRKLGVSLVGGRNSALQNLVAEVPPPLVAELLGYSYQVTQRHAELVAGPWSRYIT